MAMDLDLGSELWLEEVSVDRSDEEWGEELETEWVEELVAVLDQQRVEKWALASGFW